MSESSFSHSCQHEDEILFLQQKLSEIHQKLMQQIEITKQKELEIISLKKNKISSSHSEPDNSIFHSASSEEALSQKVWLLEENLEAMRKKVMQEIKEKKELKKKMAEQTVRYQADLKKESEKFEGLEIIYYKLMESTSVNKQNKRTMDMVESEHRFEEKSKGYIRNNKHTDRGLLQCKNKEKSKHRQESSLKKELKEAGGRDNYESSEEKQRSHVLRQILEVKNSYKRQNELSSATIYKLKLQQQKSKQSNRHDLTAED